MTEYNQGENDMQGDYETIHGIKTRCRELGRPRVSEFIERAENRIIKEEDGYTIGLPEDDGEWPSYDIEMLFHLGILVGAALEREYPATVEGSE